MHELLMFQNAMSCHIIYICHWNAVLSDVVFSLLYFTDIHTHACMATFMLKLYCNVIQIHMYACMHTCPCVATFMLISTAMLYWHSDTNTHECMATFVLNSTAMLYWHQYVRTQCLHGHLHAKPYCNGLVMTPITHTHACMDVHGHAPSCQTLY